MTVEDVLDWVLGILALAMIGYSSLLGLQELADEKHRAAVVRGGGLGYIPPDGGYILPRR